MRQRHSLTPVPDLADENNDGQEAVDPPPQPVEKPIVNGNRGSKRQPSGPTPPEKRPKKGGRRGTSEQDAEVVSAGNLQHGRGRGTGQRRRPARVGGK